ncbi:MULTISPECIES: hypothetical protein [Francisella]|uniref:hypothetical protein n=1 Tax=Francisella TaxID=262 RepID=UPI0002D54109|nr:MULTISPECIES: hypothetical protein [Francisella]AJI72565.1 hypothetical protein AQ14_69 [Francisella tularensis subsp. novicida D9876]MBK2110863.1 hypothetical protein [Francisella tularensis subsp. novicida FSC159]OIN83156.1 hypothetical protein KX00_1346 [Francisella sp. TX07-6608]
MTENLELKDHDRVDLFYISKYTEFDFIEIESYYKHLKWLLKALGTSYNRDFVANYLFAQLFV